jgi:hypothetical protein
MEDSQPVVIAKFGAHYHVAQGSDVLLRVPAEVFERFDTNCVFPPLWGAPQGIHPVRRLYWNPESREFLMFGLDEQTVRFGETFGPSGYRSFVQGFWTPSPPLTFLRPYWNPTDPYEPFDAAARRCSFHAQRSFLDLLARLRPPEGYGAILNTVAPYLDELGLNPEGQPGDPDEILELSLTPPAPLADSLTAAVLETLGIEQAGECFPVLRGEALVGVHALGLRELHVAERIITDAGLDCREGPALPH